MRTAILRMLVTLTAAVAVTQSVSAGVKVSHLRCVSGGCDGLVADAIERSPVVGRLVSTLEHSDVVVYLHLPGAMPLDEPVSRLMFVSAAAGVRYLMVEIDPWRTSYPDRIALLGHELYHALEVAAAPEVKDLVSLRQLYERIGHVWRGSRFETEQARVAEREVRKDLVRPRPDLGSPAVPDTIG